MHRKRRRRPELMETAAFEAVLADHVDDPYDTLTDAITLYAAVSSLSERQRDAILLHYGMGFTAAEAAEVMGNRLRLDVMPGDPMGSVVRFAV